MVIAAFFGALAVASVASQSGPLVSTSTITTGSASIIGLQNGSSTQQRSFIGLVPKNDADWKVLKVGAGGWVTGVDIAPDGTQVIRTDTYGAYIWENGAWRQLLTRATMPPDVEAASGIYELRVAPSNSNILYMQTSAGLYRSTDKGRTWRRTNFPVRSLNPNGENRMDGQKMAIHPSDPQTVLAGTQGKGGYLTRDGGATWARINAVPPGTQNKDPGLTGIILNGSRAFIATAGAGVYESNDGAATWKSIGGPNSVNHAVLTSDGAYLASDGDSGALWRWARGQWTKVLADGNGAHALAVDPTRSGRVAFTSDGGSLRISLDHGRTWTEQNHTTKLNAVDIPWLKDSGQYMSSGGLVFDPKVPGRLSQSAGVGVWDVDVPQRIVWNTPIPWVSRSIGIEQLVTNDIVAPAGGNPILANWDRPLFLVSDPDTYQASYSPPGFSMGWSVDYASTDPSFLVALVNHWGKPDQSGFSTDGGKTWKQFAAIPASAKDSAGGSIAASTPLNFIWVPAQNRRPAYTLDGGRSWKEVRLPEVSEYGLLHSAYYLNRHIVAADRATPNVFYLYYSSETSPALFKSRDGGVTWNKVFSGQPEGWSYWNTKIEAVPGEAGHLLFSSGPQGTGEVQNPLRLMRSTDGGKSWKAVPRAKVLHFGLGAPVTPGGPAAIYMWGEVNGVRAIWGSGDAGKTWSNLGNNPLGSLNIIKVVSGDMARPGRVYVGFGGSGWAYLDR